MDLDVFDDFPVINSYFTGGVFLHLLEIVGDHNYQFVFRYFMKQFHDLGSRFGIEVPGRFVGGDNRAILGKGAGYDGSLFLTAGQSCGFVTGMLLQSDFFDDFHCHGSGFFTGLPRQ